MAMRVRSDAGRPAHRASRSVAPQGSDIRSRTPSSAAIVHASLSRTDDGMDEHDEHEAVQTAMARTTRNAWRTLKYYTIADERAHDDGR